MKTIQFTLTVEEGKEIIALGISRHPLFLEAFRKGKVLLKGGTTVSRLAEIVVGFPLRICGRITPRGTVSALESSEAPHSILYDGEKWVNVDDSIVEVVQGMGPGDLIVCGANAVDMYGNAAMMAGSVSGGNPGLSLSSWFTEGMDVLIAAGTEKLVPGNLQQAASLTGRKGKYLSWGMSVGLLIIPGCIINELEAIKILTDVECYAIGSGGLGEAKGSITLVARGEGTEIDRLVDLMGEIKSKKIRESGEEVSLRECQPGKGRCAHHLGCCYRSGLFRNRWRDEND